MTARRGAAARYDAGNLEAARLVLADTERYGGPDSLIVIWARLVVEKAAPTIRGPLFAEERVA